MTRDVFEQLVKEIGLTPVPQHIRARIKNVAFIIEDEPRDDVRAAEGLAADETLLGLYYGVPQTARGDQYGVGMTLPDTITLFQRPIEEAGGGDMERIRAIVADTIWHEVAHHFGIDHDEMERRGNTISN